MLKNTTQIKKKKVTKPNDIKVVNLIIPTLPSSNPNTQEMF